MTDISCVRAILTASSWDLSKLVSSTWGQVEWSVMVTRRLIPFIPSAFVRLNEARPVIRM